MVIRLVSLKCTLSGNESRIGSLVPVSAKLGRKLFYIRNYTLHLIDGMKVKSRFTCTSFPEALCVTFIFVDADVPVKVVGIFSQRNERSLLWKLIYCLYERLSIFHYGRVELIMFISQKEYTVSSYDFMNQNLLGMFKLNLRLNYMIFLGLTETSDPSQGL